MQEIIHEEQDMRDIHTSITRGHSISQVMKQSEVTFTTWDGRQDQPTKGVLLSHQKKLLNNSSWNFLPIQILQLFLNIFVIRVKCF